MDSSRGLIGLVIIRLIFDDESRGQVKRKMITMMGISNEEQQSGDGDGPS